MGLGDEIMSAGHARIEHEKSGGPVIIGDWSGRARWSEVWENIDYIIPPEFEGKFPQAKRIINCSGHRPYIDRWDVWEGRPAAVYSSWRAQDHRARLVLSEAEKQAAKQMRDGLGKYIIIEPYVRSNASPNKDWGSHNYAEVVSLIKDHFQIVQIGPSPAILSGVNLTITTSKFREAMAAMSAASGYIGPEGGLHHCAAAFDVPAVVFFGHFVPERTTGYPDHCNIGGGSGCGRWAPCPECTAMKRAVTPHIVAEAAKIIFSHAQRRINVIPS